MPRTGKNLHKRKDGRWEGRYIKAYSESGKAVYGYVYARPYRDAKAKLEQARNRNDESPASDVQPECPELFKDVAKAWLASVKPHVKESTSVKYANLLESYIQPTIGAVPLNELTRDRIEAQCAELLRSGGTKSGGAFAENGVKRPVGSTRRTGFRRPQRHERRMRRKRRESDAKRERNARSYAKRAGKVEQSPLRKSLSRQLGDSDLPMRRTANRRDLRVALGGHFTFRADHLRPQHHAADSEFRLQ